MIQLENEIQQLKLEVINMWNLVALQLDKAQTAMLEFDKDLAREVVQKEKRVNAYELKIDRDCEDIFALFSPVAIDLRFLLAALKINSNLERTGDIAEGIARYVIDSPVRFNPQLLETTRLLFMYREAMEMFTDTRVSFEKEDTNLARGIFKKDDILDEINKQASGLITACIKEDINCTEEALYILSIIRRLERVGDQLKNIAEEIIFYAEAKVLKHQKRES